MKVYDPFCKDKWGRAQVLDKAIFNKIQNILVCEFAEQRAQAILLLPVFLATGIGAYFSLAFEPPWLFGFIALGLSFILACVIKNYMRFMMIAFLCVAMGFVAAQIRTHVVYTPILSQKLDFKDVEGRIVAVETLEKGTRLTLSEVQIESVDANETPRKVRLKLWNGDEFVVGQRVRGLAALNPPSPPVIPKGFDFQRYMYFRGIGAVGFLYGAPEIVQDVESIGFADEVERVRQFIGARIMSSLDAPQSGLARALMVGQRTSINDSDMNAIRASGLAHMLAISGLHVGLFSGVVFFALRFGMALFPSLALRYPIKKYAAVAAIGAALFYMMIAGATIPTQRAMISVAVIFTAILLDRSPISLRVVAFAAFCVLLFFPESLTSASFQMSFAAVTALVAFYDWTRPVWGRWARQAGMFKKAGLYFVGVASTTVIATLATAPLTLFHFQALPAYGVLANVICVPLLAFIVMPLAILAFILMPFGMEGVVFALMEPGLDVILRLAHFVSALDAAVFHVPAFAFTAMVFFILASLALIMLRARLRVMFVVLFCVMTFVNFQWIQYDILVSSKVDLIAIDANEPQLIVSDARKSQFMRKNWEEALGFEGMQAFSLPEEGDLSDGEYNLLCDAVACRYETRGQKVSYLKRYNVQAFQQECEWANVIISADVYDDEVCDAEYAVNRRTGKYQGVHAFRLRHSGVTMDRVEDFRGDRPWVQIPRKRY